MPTNTPPTIHEQQEETKAEMSQEQREALKQSNLQKIVYSEDELPNTPEKFRLRMSPSQLLNENDEPGLGCNPLRKKPSEKTREAVTSLPSADK